MPDVVQASNNTHILSGDALMMALFHAGNDNTIIHDGSSDFDMYI